MASAFARKSRLNCNCLQDMGYFGTQQHLGDTMINQCKPERITLKNGHIVFVRPVKVQDAYERHQFFVTLSMGQIGVVHTTDEIDVHTEESEQQIKDFLFNQRGLWLVAVNDAQTIVGEVDITIKNFARIKHNGFLTMGIVPDYQGLGLGTALMQAALAWATERGLLRLELSVFKINIVAQHLYQKFGFVVEGVRKNYLKNTDGTWGDDIIMAKYLSGLPT